jgi:D-threo-aldose 1-dehydrogenase
MALSSAGMPGVVIPGTSLRCSRFIFGTASLFNVGSRARRLALLTAAVDAGFTHFDTAPYYGFGWAERDLGELLRIRPGITVTTKVGIYSPGGEDATHAAVFLRKAVGRLVPAISRPTVDFTLSRARKMLDASLSRLARERVELYMLHDPQPAMVQTDEWSRWLENEVDRGRVGAFGVASTADRLVSFLDQAPGLAAIVQAPDSLDAREADCLLGRNSPLPITYGYVSAARSRGDSRAVSDILVESLRRNADGAIIVSTTRMDRLWQYPAILKNAA